MRKQKKHYSHILAFASVLLLLSLGQSTTEGLRGFTVSFLSPFWESAQQFKSYTQSIVGTHVPFSNGPVKTLAEEVEKLRLQNHLLKQELSQLKELYQQELSLYNHLQIVQQKVPLNDDTKASLPRHAQDLQKLLKWQLEAIPARVIFRSPVFWESTLWLNVGEADNELLHRQVIAKNSPVVFGTSVVGVVEEVGLHQCRVRLITDASLTPSVRAVRSIDNKTWHLAKGELQGSSRPLWRSRSHTLKGIGFNYDYADEEGPARDLRSGKPLKDNPAYPEMPLLKVNDLLVTTGLDGVFPPGLSVAVVTKIKPLHEGDYFYELEAKPTVGEMDNLSLLFVMPPQQLSQES